MATRTLPPFLAGLVLLLAAAAATAQDVATDASASDEMAATGVCSDCDQCDDWCCCGPWDRWNGPCRDQFNLWYLSDACPCHVLDDSCFLQNNQASITGWANGGVMANATNPPSHFNGPVTFPDRNQAQFNQMYLIAQRTAACDNCGWFVGGRVDLLYGSDYVFTTAAGLDGTPAGNIPQWGNFNYGLAMPQLYAEVAYDDIKVKLGHFYTIIGNESVMARNNFFYTHSYAFQYGQPITHTGALATRTVGNWSWAAGLVGGWNTFNTNDRANFLGGLSYSDEDWGTFSGSIISGSESTVNLPGIAPFANRTMSNLIWTRNLGANSSYLIQFDYGVQQQAATLTGTGTARWCGINQQLLYRLNDRWTAGGRFEWFRDSDGFNVTGLRPANPLVGNFFAGDFYALAVGLNYQPSSNLLIRPELRYDWFNASSAAVGSQNPFNDTTSSTQFLFGLDAIYQF